VVTAAVLVTVLAILLATLGVHASAVIENPTRVASTLALLIGVVAIVAALQDAELRHRDEAVLDPLTGLLNRHALKPRFAEIRQQARIADQPVCLVLCDIDEFKSVNDAHGHDIGDAVLRDVAYEMRKGLRSFELVYRLGGEEFLIVLPGIDLQGGHEVAERIRVAIDEANPGGVPVTISAGVSAAEGDAVRYDELFKTADLALYAAKHGGRNRVVASVPAADPTSREAFPSWTARTTQPIPGDAPAVADPEESTASTADSSLAGP
jgi:diguanylate cyclase (GGDEF)-like protein